MITQANLRSILPGKIARAVMIIAQRNNELPMNALKEFYASETYANLEKEETKYWWLSPEQLADTIVSK
jgi:hypothetical protein